MTCTAILPLAIRPAHDGDGDGIADLIARAWGEYPGTVFDREAELPELNAPATHFAALGGALWVLGARDGVVRGSVGIAPDETGEVGLWELHKMYLDPGLRGSGWAARLLARAETHVAAAGGRAIGLWTDTRFQAAHRFYQKSGYRRLPGERVLQDLSASHEYAFRKDLAGACR